jgi:EAL domain-containing protein (putative c-di-GMP-specific phosphodiesterase class I)
MELETIAEYVENDKTRNLLKELGVDYAQGHVSGKPVPLEQALQNLQERMNSSAG